MDNSSCALRLKRKREIVLEEKERKGDREGNKERLRERDNNCPKETLKVKNPQIKRDENDKTTTTKSKTRKQNKTNQATGIGRHGTRHRREGEEAHRAAATEGETNH